MTTTINPPREGVLLPGFRLPRGGGGTVRVRDYRGRRALVLVFVHDSHCDGCRTFLGRALDAYAAYGDEDAEVIAVVPDRVERVASLQHDLALPFPIAVDAEGAVARRYGLAPGRDAAVMVTDRYGEPRIWHVAGVLHDFPDHDALIAEARYLALTCSGGCSTPIWNDP